MKDRDLYTIAVMRYKETNLNIKDEELFPINFNLSKNYHLKTEIIAEAIQKGILIEKTDNYQKKFLKKL